MAHSFDIGLAAIAIFLGGFLKGATGAGGPVVAVPILASLFGVQFAVAVYSVINLLSNIWQAYAFREHRSKGGLVWPFSLAGGGGALVGSVLLAHMPTNLIMAILSLVVFSYIGLKLLRPNRTLTEKHARRFASPVGFIGGLMQGAGGVSAPVSVTFLHASPLKREEFIAIISTFFVAMSLTQIPTLWLMGLITQKSLLYSIVGCIPLFLAMPLGGWAAKHLSKEWFDRVILVLLAALATRMMWSALTG